MSDFVRNLVRRGAGLAAVVAPRTPPPVADITEEAVEVRAPVAPPPLRARAARSEIVAERAPARRAEAAPVGPPRREFEAPPQPRPSEAAREEAGRLEVVMREEPAPQAVEQKPRAAPESAPELLKPPKPPEAPAAAATQVLIVHPHSTEEPHREESTRPRQAERPAPPVARLVPFQRLQATSPPEVRLVEPRAAAERATRNSPAVRAEPESQEQQARGVEVRIGRIEIHQAAPPAAPARRPSRGFENDTPARRYLDRRWY